MRLSKLTVVSLSALASLLLAPTEAQAVSIFAADCNFGFQDVYNPGDAVCVSGDLDVVPPMGICAEAFVIVTPVDSANPFFDVTNPEGIPNYILGCAGAGAFFDEYVWLPPLKPGQYDLVIDQFPFGGGFNPAEDLRVTNAFTVSNAPLVFSVDVAAIKGAAVDGLAYAQALHDLTELLTLIDTLSTVADWAGTFGPGGAIAAILLNEICGRLGIDCPTSYNSAVIIIGNKIIGHMSEALTLHYTGIIADPPDPMFEDVVPLHYEDAIANGAPWAPGAGAVLPTQQTLLGQSLSTQAAAYQALLPTIEKLQGADQAGSHYGLLVQSEKTIAYANLAIEAGDAMLTELDTLQAMLEAEGTYATEVDVAPTVEAIVAGEISDEDRAVVRSFGYEDADIDLAVASLAEMEIDGPLSWQGIIGNARNQFEVMRPALEDLVMQAENIRAENEPYALRNAPVAMVSAPMAGNVGDALALSASGTHIDPDAMLSYAWDLDGDGEFDDAMGADIEFTPAGPGLVIVSAEVTDGSRRDIAMASILVNVDNVPPEFTALQPEGYAPFADVGEMVELSAEAVDADGDPVTLTWYVDDVESGSGASLAFQMPDELPHIVRVVAADDDPYSADAQFAFHVRSSIWEDEAGGTGGNDTGGASGGVDDTAGGATAGSASASASGADGTAADTDSGGADGGDGGGGCGCNSGPRTPAWAGLLLVVLGLRRRRR